jgi:phospholipase C
MPRLTLLLCWLALGFGASALIAMQGCSSAPISQKIQHVVVIFQENRTPDNLFHGLPGADIANSGVNSHGEIIPLTPIALSIPYDLNHDHPSFVEMYDNGKMDGANLITWSCAVGTQNCPPPNPQFAYVQTSDVEPYMQMAEQYTFGDRMFQTNQGPSFPAHQFIISGTSAPSVGSTLFVAENPVGVATAASDTGCTAPPEETVAVIDPQGSESTKIYPCFEHPTLTDLLDEKGISWKYYTPSAGSIWTGPNAISHMRMGKDWNNVVLQETQVLSDIANKQLPLVSWVVPDGLSSDHAEANDGSGPSWVASIVNAIGISDYWANTTIIITWDDWGGWYDHVPPKVINSYEYGFRVPLIIVSPYARKAYVSHVTHDFGSVLKFIENLYGLGTLGYADVNADDLSDCFDFTKPPSSFQVIPAQYSADHFLNRKGPPTDPDDD